MKTEIIALNFDRDETGKVPFTDKNMELLLKYVIPIIEKNRGWATESLTRENFLKDPEKWSGDIDSTVEGDPKAEVFVAVADEKPVGLLVYIVEEFDQLESPELISILLEMCSDIDSKYWKRMEEHQFFDHAILEKYFKDLKQFIYSKKQYKHIGVVVSPELQGKKSGVSDQLYSMMDEGFLFGWTSTPPVLAKRRQLYRHTIFCPPTREEVNSLETLACLTVAASRIFGKYPEIVEQFGFGINTHPGFILRDKPEYMELSKSFLDKGKISQADYDRLDKILDYERGQGIVISVS